MLPSPGQLGYSYVIDMLVLLANVAVNKAYKMFEDDEQVKYCEAIVEEARSQLETKASYFLFLISYLLTFKSCVCAAHTHTQHTHTHTYTHTQHTRTYTHTHAHTHTQHAHNTHSSACF